MASLRLQDPKRLPRSIPNCIIRRFFLREVSFIDSALRLLFVSTQFSVLSGSERNVSAKDVFGALANAVDKLLVTLFNVLFLGLVSQFIYTFEYRQEPSHTIVHDEMTSFVTYVTFYASVVLRLRYCIRLYPLIDAASNNNRNRTNSIAACGNSVAQLEQLLTTGELISDSLDMVLDDEMTKYN